MFLKSSSPVALSTAINYDKSFNFNPATPSTNYIDDRDLLRIFITGIYKSTDYFSSIYKVPNNTCGLFMYQHVFSKFVIPNNAATPNQDRTYTGTGSTDGDGNVISTTTFTHNFLIPLLTSELPDQSSKTTFLGGIDKFVDLKLNGGKLIIPGPLHAGLLLDGCHIMAMMKIRYILLKDVNTLKRNDISLRDMYDAPLGDDTRLSDISRILLDVLFSKNFGSIEQSEFKLKDPADVSKRACINFLHPDTVFEYDQAYSRLNADCQIVPGYETPISDYNYRDSAINKMWHFKGIKMFSMKNDDLLGVLRALSKKKATIIDGFTLAIFKALKGSVKGLSTDSLIIGDGSDTKGLVDQPYAGVNLFSYDYGIHEKCREINVRTHAAYSQQIKFLPLADYQNKLKKIHFDVFALDADPTISTPTEIDDRDNFFVIINIPTTTQTYVLKNVNFGIEPTDAPKLNPRYDRWVYVKKVTTGTAPNIVTTVTPNDNIEYGYYIMETNDLVITDNTITALDIHFVNKRVAVGPSGKAKSDNEYIPGTAEIVLTVSTFAEEPLKHLSLDLNAGQLFRNDGFEIKSVDRKNNFWNKTNSVEREKIKELIRIIKRNGTNVTTVLTGGGIGMIAVPPVYDSSKTYVEGEYVLFGNKPYVAKSNTDPNLNKTPSAETDFWLESVIQGGSHSYNFEDAIIPDFIYDATTKKIYRLKKSYTSTDTTIPTENWEEIARIYSDTRGYSIDDLVIYDNKWYVARAEVPIGGEAFKESSWKRLSSVMTDPRYLPFSKTTGGTFPDSPTITEPLSDVSLSQLQKNTYDYLRYSFAEFELDTNLVNIKIQSYASPLASRLGFRYSWDTSPHDFNLNTGTLNSERKTFIDKQTIAGKNPTASTAFKYTVSSKTLPSYNQALSALRCFGILETIVCRIKSISKNDTTVVSKLDGILNSSLTVKTAPLYNSAGTAIVPNNENIIKYTDTSPSNFGYLELKWYTASTEAATDYTGCDD